MPEKQPQPNNALTPEEEARKQRYLTNLENIQNSELEDLYPPEMKKREWVEITDEAELNQAKEQMRFLKNEIPPQLYGLFRDEDGEHTYFVRRFNKFPKARNIQLDMLATAKEIAPWAEQKGMVYEGHGSEKEAWSAKCGPWSFSGNLIRSDAVIMENVINGLGDPKYSHEQKKTFLRDDISAIVHENTHINNTDSIDFGGPARKITETAPMSSEYLAFPGKNSKMKIVTERARKLLRGEQKNDDYYNDATLMGMLVMTRDEGLLPEEEDVERIDESLTVWQSQVESLPAEELIQYRRKVEAEWLLSEDDIKLHAKLQELRQQYPNLMHRLLGDYKLKGEG